MKTKLIIPGWYEVTDSAGEVYELKMATNGRVSRNDGWYLRNSKGHIIIRARTKAEVMSQLTAMAGAL
jgi:hypothetical protein